jgi:hypothetical protein
MKRTLLWAATLALVAGHAHGQSACSPSGLYAAVDLLYLSPKISDQGLSDIFFYGNVPASAEYGGSLDAPLEFAQRVTLGYQGELGGGARVRWFTFDNELDYVGEWENGGPVIDLLGGAELDVDAIDAELTQRGNFRAWTWMASGGARYGRVSFLEETINFEDIPAAVFLGTTGVVFEGGGPTFAVEACRSVIWDGFSLFGNCRTSLLFGDTDVHSAFDGDGQYHINNDFVQVWELQSGGRFLVPLMPGLDLIGAIFWEAQRWDSDSNFLGDLAFHGFGTQVGILY